MAATYIHPCFIALPKSRYYTARTLAKISAVGSSSELRSFLRTSRWQIDKPLALGCDPTGWTCLLFACNYLNSQNILLLLNMMKRRGKLDLDFSTPDGMTLLMAIVVASSEDNEEEAIICAQLLVIAGLDVSNVTTTLQNGRTVLTMAVWKGNANLVKYLLEVGANPNLRDGFGETPFNIAVSESMKSVMEILYAGGSNPYILNLNREMCSDLAMQYAPKMEHYVSKLLMEYRRTKYNHDHGRFNDMLQQVNSDCTPIVNNQNDGHNGTPHVLPLISACFKGLFAIVVIGTFAKLAMR